MAFLTLEYKKLHHQNIPTVRPAVLGHCRWAFTTRWALDDEKRFNLWPDISTHRRFLLQYASAPADMQMCFRKDSDCTIRLLSSRMVNAKGKAFTDILHYRKKSPLEFSVWCCISFAAAVHTSKMSLFLCFVLIYFFCHSVSEYVPKFNKGIRSMEFSNSFCIAFFSF